MGNLIITSNYSEDIELYVTHFETVVTQSMPSIQTKTKQIHFPYKVNQPQIKFQVQFANEQDYESFQSFVRKHHLSAIGDGQGVKEITMKWPERGINSWTGFIRDFLAGGERFNPAPKAQFTVELVDSMISRKTLNASSAVPFYYVYGPQINALMGWWRQATTPASQNPSPVNPEVPPITPLPGGTSGGNNGGGGSW